MRGKVESEIRSMSRWILSPRSRAMKGGAFWKAFCTRLLDEGVPLARGYTALRTMHPEVHVQGLEWEQEGALKPIDYWHGVATSPTFTNSPVAAAFERGLDVLRVPLEVPEDEIEYPLLLEQRAMGATDYLLTVLHAGRSDKSIASYTTARPGGFTDDEVRLLCALAEPLSIRVEFEAMSHATESLLTTYLGRNASKRVLDGAFLRGEGERIQAVIWMSDLRGFTTLVDQHAGDDAIAALDAYFACMADPIHSGGGEILKFIGDAVLAVFPFDDDTRHEACARALKAAVDAKARLELVNGEGRFDHVGGLRFGVALHTGEVHYGNIGSGARLDFTVIGKAVNEAARIEGKCKDLGATILLSEAFAEGCGAEQLRSLGRHELRGVSAPTELFTI